jgi:hypothetical protein
MENEVTPVVKKNHPKRLESKRAWSHTLKFQQGNRKCSYAWPLWEGISISFQPWRVIDHPWHGSYIKVDRNGLFRHRNLTAVSRHTGHPRYVAWVKGKRESERENDHRSWPQTRRTGGWPADRIPLGSTHAFTHVCVSSKLVRSCLEARFSFHL